MSKVCLVGVGTPSFLPARVHTGPSLRTTHFACALAAAGHEVSVIYTSGSAHPGLTPAFDIKPLDYGGAVAGCLGVDEKDFDGPRLRSFIEESGFNAIVGVTAYAAALVARLGLGLPFWADVFGDPMAEAQAKAVATGNDAVLVRFWSMLGPVLEKADRFSAVSRAQSHALVGQLGLAGRLCASTAGQALVEVVPCAAATVGRHGQDSQDDLASSLPDFPPADSFVVLWSGSFNTWCDIEGLFAGLNEAMEAEPSLHFVATGAGIKGHDEDSYRRFSSLVATSPYSRRFHLYGWVESQTLPACYDRADVGVVFEHDLYERRLGSENRVVQWMAAGLPSVSTGLSELGVCLRARGLAFACSHGDPSSLAHALVELARDRRRVAAAGLACRSYAERCFSFDVTARPLLDWCAAPVRAADSGRQRPLSIGLFSEPAAVVHLLEAYLAGLGLGQVLYRSLRWMGRRLLGRGLRT